jgi:hypothetical protein
MTTAAVALDEAHAWLLHGGTLFRRIDFELWQFGPEDTIRAVGQLRIFPFFQPILAGLTKDVMAGFSALGGPERKELAPASLGIICNRESGSSTGASQVIIYRASGPETHLVSWSYDGTSFTGSADDGKEFWLTMTRWEFEADMMRSIATVVLAA